MAKYKEREKGQGYFLTIYPEDIFDEYSFERVITKFIEENINETIFDWRYKNDQTGQKALSPLIKLKVILYAISTGVKSSHKIESLLKNKHLAYLYLSENNVMDHSTICNFINDFPDEIMEVFYKLLMVIEELKLIDWNLIMIDGTKVKANASKELTGTHSSLLKKLESY